MSSPSHDDEPLTAETVLTLIKALSIPERTRLFKALDHRPSLSEGTGYITLPGDIVDLLLKHFKQMTKMYAESGHLIADLGRQAAGRNRKPDKVRLGRGI